MDKTAFFKLSYGLYIVSANYNGKPCGCVVNTVEQVTATPEQLIVAVSKDNYTSQAITSAKSFSITVMSETIDPKIIGEFGFKTSKEVNKFLPFTSNIDYNGNPYITDGMSARFSCRLVKEVDLGSHILYVGEVTDAEVISDRPVMTYDYYHRVKKGVTPKNASSYQESPKTEDAPPKTKWRCTVCGYEVEMDELPEDYVCPICGQPRSVFEKINS